MVDIRSDKRWTANINARLLADARQTPGSTHRLTIERFDARPELEGERLILLGARRRCPFFTTSTPRSDDVTNCPRH
jgi:hypothetical protein